MKMFEFVKMSGAGNDFIVADNFVGKIKLSAKQVALICRRKLGLDADGVILLERRKGYDFYMRYYNNDGSEAEMCGNAARCISRFAYEKGHVGRRIKFLAKDGPHEAVILPSGAVSVKMTAPTGYKKGIKVKAAGKTFAGSFINTGVPHFVATVRGLVKMDIVKPGREIRFSKKFSPKGTNVMFIEKAGKDKWAIRSYERGVEDETLACGTGATAAALILAAEGKAKSPVTMKAPGGTLRIQFRNDAKGFSEVWLEGPADMIAEGRLLPAILS